MMHHLLPDSLLQNLKRQVLFLVGGAGSGEAPPRPTRTPCLLDNLFPVSSILIGLSSFLSRNLVYAEDVEDVWRLETHPLLALCARVLRCQILHDVRCCHGQVLPRTRPPHSHQSVSPPGRATMRYRRCLVTTHALPLRVLLTSTSIVPSTSPPIPPIHIRLFFAVLLLRLWVLAFAKPLILSCALHNVRTLIPSF